MNRHLFKALQIAMILFLNGIAIPARADDTDIYINNTPIAAEEPEVMFLLDYRANANSSICSNIDPASDGDGASFSVADIQNRCSAEGYSNDEAQAFLDTGAFDADDDITFYDVLFASLKLVLDELDGVKIGFMMSHNNNNNCEGPVEADNKDSNSACSDGGFILSGFNSMDASDSNGAKANFISIIRNIQRPQGSVSHSFQGKETMFEFFRYLTGQTVYNGHLGWTDFGTSSARNLDDTNDNAGQGGADSPVWDSSIETGGGATTRYVSPVTGQCAKIFTVNFVFGVTNQDTESDAAIQASKASGGMGITLSGGGDTQFRQVLEFLNDEDLANSTTYPNTSDLDGTQNVISYFLVPSPSTTENSWAAAGGTNNAYSLGSDPQAIADQLNSIFESILSVSTTFVAPSVPVNVFNRSQTEDDVFLAVFKADENSLPFWPGNVKRLKIANVTLPDGTASFELQDQNSDPAIDTDGRIKLTALTLWTDTGDTDMSGAIQDEAADGVDGRAVERGGAGQQIPGFLPVATGSPGLSNSDSGARQIFTEALTDGSGGDGAIGTNGLIALDADATTGDRLFNEITRDWSTPPTGATYAASSAADQTHILDILEYVRGFESDGTTKRSWMVGDPLHSRPLTINYGARTGYTTDDPDIRILYGTNDGLFHMIKNTEATTLNPSGEEVWAFAPRETMPVWDRLESGTVGTPIHPYTIDGSATSLVIDVNGDGTITSADGDKVYVVFGLRRGGKSYYAFDVTDPDNPVYLWRISKYDDPLNPDTSTINSDFAELSQSWSKPVAGYKKIDLDSNGTFDDGDIDADGDGDKEKVAVFVFGGGYNGDDGGDNLDDDDASADYQDGTGLGKDQANRDRANSVSISIGADDFSNSTPNEEGNAVFMVKATTGELIWKAVRGTPDNSYTSSSKKLTHSDLVDSIPSEVAAVDTTGDGLLDRIYTGDTGGRVWRFDIPGTDRSTWTANILLNAGRHVVADRANDRRFFNRPDVVQAAQGTDVFDAVLIGSGDRENPLGTDVENAFFMIKDKGITSGSPTTLGLTHSNSSGDQSLADVTDNCLQTGTEASCSLDTSNGWFMNLGLGTTGTGEKNLAAAVTLGGIVFFTTFSPTSSTCGLNEGTGKQFALNLFDATGAYNYNTANDSTNGYSEDRFDTIESGGIPVEAVPLGNDILLFQGQAGEETIQNTGALTSWRTYWYEKDKN